MLHSHAGHYIIHPALDVRSCFCLLLAAYCPTAAGAAAGAGAGAGAGVVVLPVEAGVPWPCVGVFRDFFSFFSFFDS